MPPALENKGLTAYNKFIAFDGRIISLDFPSLRGGFDSPRPLHMRFKRTAIGCPLFISLYGLLDSFFVYTVIFFAKSRDKCLFLCYNELCYYFYMTDVHYTRTIRRH